MRDLSQTGTYSQTMMEFGLIRLVNRRWEDAGLCTTEAYYIQRRAEVATATLHPQQVDINSKDEKKRRASYS